jgi:inhibitor of cysteine peptidase
MKTKLAMIFLVIGILLVFGACNAAQTTTGTTTPGATPNQGVPPAPGKYAVIVSGSDFTNTANIKKQLVVHSGDLFSIALDSNASTGFSWTAQANIGDPGILEQTTHEYIAPDINNNPPVVGMAGFEEWTFKALTAGITTIKLSYDRPWTGGEKGVRTFELDITIN